MQTSTSEMLWAMRAFRLKA